MGMKGYVNSNKRKNTDPGLLLIQSDYSIRDLPLLETKYSLMVEPVTEPDSDTTPTYDPASESRHSLPSLPTLSSDSCQVTQHSSSFSSWTKPIQGKKESDSCEPGSSILDLCSEQVKDYAPESLNQVVVTGASADISVCRESEADTSKDVSDIESDWGDDLVQDTISKDVNIKISSKARHASTVVVSYDAKRNFEQNKIKKFSL